MSGVPIDVSCPECGAGHPQHEAVEEVILTGLRVEELEWVCPECDSVARIESDVEEL